MQLAHAKDGVGGFVAVFALGVVYYTHDDQALALGVCAGDQHQSQVFIIEAVWPKWSM